VQALRILGGGAAQGLVARLAPTFEASAGWTIAGEFGAVGTMAAKLRDGAVADAVVLTAALVNELKSEGRIAADSIQPVGVVETSLAVRAQDEIAAINDAATLRQVFLDCDAIFVPDTIASTAGIHAMKVLQRLGIADQVASRLNVFPNGALAMQELAASRAARPIGCTQATEIIATPGLKLAGNLPGEFALSTIYTAAVAAHAVNGAIARLFIDLLADRRQQPLRTTAGFLEIRG
jgi:molybdate transport system substrate-binding protein